MTLDIPNFLSCVAAVALLGQGPAQAAAAASDPLGGWGSLGAHAVNSSLLAIIVIRLYPQSVKESREEREKRDATFSKLVADMDQKFQERNDQTINNLTAAIKEQTATFAQTMRDSLRADKT